MPSAVLFPLVAQGVVPLLLTTMAGSRRHSSRLSWFFAVLLAWMWIVAIALAGVWLVLPWWLAIAHALLLVLVATRAFGAVRGRPLLPSGARSIAVTAALGVALAIAATITLAALAGRRSPGATIDLAPPLHGGTYLVANGGSNALVSAHVATLADIPRFRPWRGQSYGVDLVRLNAAGLRADGILPATAARYEIFGDTVLAPCAGRVVQAVDGLADMPVPEADRRNMAGNHVVLECEGVWILLAHMRRGSVLVTKGHDARLGDPVGQVGNSGNSGEPHLHLHVQRPGTDSMPFGAEPIPLTIAGRYLVRGQRVRW